MQACLARLYTDDTFRNLFYLEPRSVLDKYVLTDDEQIAMKAIDRERLNFFASSLKVKRKSKYQRAYPALFKLDSAIIDRGYQRYYQLYPARPTLSQQAEILQFGRFMEETLGNFPALPPYARELARYESMIATMSFNRQEKEGNHRQERREIHASDKPTVREGVQIETFVYDIATIHDALLNDEQLLEVREGQYSILFQHGSLSGPRFFSVSGGTKALLDNCDGNITLTEIVDRLQRQYNATSLSNSIMALANRMLELEVIEVKFHGEHDAIAD
jgi:hypothetical protein